MSLLWLAAVALDGSSYDSGERACADGFSGTELGFPSSEVTYDCTSTELYLLNPFLDFAIFCFFFLLWLVWDLCPDLYNGSPNHPPKSFFNISAFFTTWTRVSALMFLGAAAALANVIASAIQTGTSAGTTITVIGGTWDLNVCPVSPFVFLSPFSFTLKDTVGGETTSPAFCGWPSSVTNFRITMSCLVAVLTVVFLRVPRVADVPVLAEAYFFLAALLWFIVFVVDANSFTLGLTFCNGDFSNVPALADAITNCPTSPPCTADCTSSQNYLAPIIIDFFLFLDFFIVWMVWEECPDKHANIRPLAEATPYAAPAPATDSQRLEGRL